MFTSFTNRHLPGCIFGAIYSEPGVEYVYIEIIVLLILDLFLDQSSELITKIDMSANVHLLAELAATGFTQLLGPLWSTVHASALISGLE